MNGDILIFADISPVIGTGHFWRTARLANELSAIGQRVTLAMPDNELARTSVARHLEAGAHASMLFLPIPETRTPFPYDPLPLSVTDFIPRGPNVALIDSYRFREPHLKVLRHNYKELGFVEDFGHISRIDQRFASFVVSTRQGPLPTTGRSVLAYQPPDYHFLQEALFNENCRTNKSVIVAFGGLDRGQLGLRLVDTMLHKNPGLIAQGYRFKISVPVAESDQTYDARSLISRHGHAIDIVRRYEPASFFREAAFIICAGGQTVFEAQASRLRFFGAVALNVTQDDVCRFLDRHNVPTERLPNFPKAAISSQIMDAFAEKICPVMSKEKSVLLPALNPKGLNQLAREVARLCATPRPA